MTMDIVADTTKVKGEDKRKGVQMAYWEVDFNCRFDVNGPEIVSKVARVDALAKVIHGIPLPPAVQRRIDALNIVRAVRGTTGIEGTEVSESEVERIISAPPEQPVLADTRQRAEQEVRNAEHVMRFVDYLLRQDPNHPVTEDLVRKIHQLTTENIEYEANEPGVYRNHSVHAGTYVPPRTGELVRQRMEEFIEWFNNDKPKGWPPAVRAIVAHFYVVSIHPFGDGNGRTARGVESFLLYQGGINALGFYSLANYYYQLRTEYEAMLDYVRFQTNGNITPFIDFALTGLVAEQEAVHEQILAEVTIIAFRDFARERLAEDRKLGTKHGERMFHFLLGLPEEPVLISQLRKGGHPLSQLYHGIGPKTISRDLNYLESRGLIKIERDQIRANVEVMKQFVR
jgi:Fic family protein